MMVTKVGASSRFSMGGEWAGHYADPNSLREEGPIYGVTAILVQAGGKIDGTMIDLDPIYEIPYRRFIEGLPPKDHTRLTEFARRFKDVRIRLCLPERSRIAGRIVGDKVELVKCYEGPQTVIWLSEGKEIAKEVVPNHQVHYLGTFDEGGEVLDGVWTIRKKGFLGLLGKLEGDGSFHLCRRTS
jgi:hypothetical protein